MKKRNPKKFKKELIKQIKEDANIEEQQKRLKEKYKIQEDVVVVEKRDTFKFLIKIVIRSAKLLISILIFLLSAIGLLSLIYPDTRTALYEQGVQIYEELIRLIIG